MQPVRGTTIGVGNANEMIGIMELPNIRRKEVGLNTSWRPMRLKSYMKTSAIFGDTNATSASDFQANFATNPALGWKWVVGAVNIIPGGIFSCYVKVTLKLYVQFSLLNRVVKS